MTKEEMIERIMAARPCYSRARIEALSKFWPDDVTVTWLLKNKHRGPYTVPLPDRLWLASHLLPSEVAMPPGGFGTIADAIKAHEDIENGRA